MPGLVVHTFNPSTLETWQTDLWVWSQSSLHRITMLHSETKEEKKKKRKSGESYLYCCHQSCTPGFKTFCVWSIKRFIFTSSIRDKAQRINGQRIHLLRTLELNTRENNPTRKTIPKSQPVCKGPRAVHTRVITDTTAVHSCTCSIPTSGSSHCFPHFAPSIACAGVRALLHSAVRSAGAYTPKAPPTPQEKGGS